MAALLIPWSIVIAVQIGVYLVLRRLYLHTVQDVSTTATVLPARLIFAAGCGALLAVGIVGFGHGVAPALALWAVLQTSIDTAYQEHLNRMSIFATSATLVLVEAVTSAMARRRSGSGPMAVRNEVQKDQSVLEQS